MPNNFVVPLIPVLEIGFKGVYYLVILQMNLILLFISVMTHLLTMLRMDTLSVQIGSFGLVMDFINFINRDADIDVLMNILDITFTVYTIKLYRERGLDKDAQGATIALVLGLVYNSMVLTGIHDKYLLLS